MTMPTWSRAAALTTLAALAVAAAPAVSPATATASAPLTGVTSAPAGAEVVPASVLTDPGDGSTLDDGGTAEVPSRLLAGAAEGPIRFPVGAPLGGYLRPPVGGEFFGSQTPDHVTDLSAGTADDGTPLVRPPDETRAAHSPYATYSPPTRGYHDALVTKAVVLDDGTDIVTIVKNDLIGMIDELAVGVATEVEARTGIDIADGLVMTATHTHDGPGAVANDAVRYFWMAMDTYQPELVGGVVSDIADVVVEALDARVPARFGYTTGQESRENSLNSFRRSRSPWTPERVAQQEALRRRIGVLRVDEVDDQGNAVRPLAVVMNYAAHGIVFDVENLYFSGDALGGAERALEASFDEPVVAMYVQAATGDVSPRADGAPKLQRIERFGELLAGQVRDLYDGITDFAAAPDLEAVSQRIALNRETLGYADGEYPYEWGAVQCNNDGLEEQCLPATPPGASDLADNGHAENDSFVPLDTRVTAVRIGDLAILAQPGEPLTEYGLQLLEASPFGYDDTMVFGYSQDHVGYILPDSKEDWLLGGTEGTTTFWGWKLGGRLLRANEELMAALAGTAPAPADELEVLYTTRAFVPQVPTPSARPGRAVVQPADIERFDTTVFRFEGGDPVHDLPTVRVERRAGKSDVWQPLRVRGGRVMDLPFEYELHYDLLDGVHTWSVFYEPAKDARAGEFRFVVAGVAGPLDEPYELTSEPSPSAPSPSLQSSPSVARAGGMVEAVVAYTPRPDNKRLIDAEVPSDVPAPVRAGEVVFTFADGTERVATAPTIETRDGRLVAVYRVTAPGSELPTAVTATDAYGNTGTA